MTWMVHAGIAARTIYTPHTLTEDPSREAHRPSQSRSVPWNSEALYEGIDMTVSYGVRYKRQGKSRATCARTRGLSHKISQLERESQVQDLCIVIPSCAGLFARADRSIHTLGTLSHTGSLIAQMRYRSAERCYTPSNEYQGHCTCE